MEQNDVRNCIRVALFLDVSPQQWGEIIGSMVREEYEREHCGSLQSLPCAIAELPRIGIPTHYPISQRTNNEFGLLVAMSTLLEDELLEAERSQLHQGLADLLHDTVQTSQDGWSQVILLIAKFAAVANIPLPKEDSLSIFEKADLTPSLRSELKVYWEACQR